MKSNDIFFLTECPPYHKNLFLILSISFFTLMSNLYIDIQYKEIADITTFKRVTLPPIDNNLPFHPYNFYLFFSNKKFQCSTLSFLKCKGTPKYITKRR
jgi:hypothetical protein